jgi:hypothetical protein
MAEAGGDERQRKIDALRERSGLRGFMRNWQRSAVARKTSFWGRVLPGRLGKHVEEHARNDH